MVVYYINPSFLAQDRETEPRFGGARGGRGGFAGGFAGAGGYGGGGFGGRGGFGGGFGGGPGMGGQRVQIFVSNVSSRPLASD